MSDSLGREIDLLAKYPKPKRDISKRANSKTLQQQQLARKFGKDFFDGDRKNGYGGFFYNSRFWQPVISTFQEHFGLTKESSVLDVGCAKGFMMHDFKEALPDCIGAGVDISTYCLENSIDH